MNYFFYNILGVGGELNVLQMTSRTVIVFFYTIILIRISGRRSFSLRAPFDNIILVLLGAILGRAVVGASPFFPTMVSGLVIAILHRVVAFFTLQPTLFSRFVKGSPIPIVKNGELLSSNMKRSLFSEQDLIEELRIHFHTENITQFSEINVERSGQLGALLKK